jgi:hypothetical protein
MKGGIKPMAENKNKYVSPSRLSLFLDNSKNIFSPLVHTHKIGDISDYVVDDTLSPTSNNPVANSAINAELDAISEAMGALELAIDGKADSLISGSNIKTINNESILGEGNFDLATKLYVTNAINDAKLNGDDGGNGNVDLSTYATKDYVYDFTERLEKLHKEPVAPRDAASLLMDRMFKLKGTYVNIITDLLEAYI